MKRGMRDVQWDAPWLTRWLWLVPLLAAVPAVFTGYVLDDLQQQSMVRGTYDASTRDPTELYCFSLGPGQGIDPAILSWWDDPRSSLCFLRPISSFSLWIDHSFLWSWPALPHLHSILWFLVLWLAWRAVLMRYVPLRIANLALLLTATSGALAMTVGWIASRHALVGGAFGIWGLYHYLVSRESASRSHIARELLAWCLIALGLLSSEMVLGVFGLIVAREWLTRRDRGALIRIGVYALCGLAYVAMHAKHGFGAPKYPLYLNVAGDPLTFLRALPERLLSLAGDLVFGVPSDSWVYPSFKWPLVIVCFIAAAAFVLALWRLWPTLRTPELAALRWLGVGALLSLAPALSGMAGGRGLTIAAFPAYALIATFLLCEPVQPRAADPLLRKALFAGAFLGNPVAHFAWFFVLYTFDQAGEKSLPDDQVSCPPQSDVYMVDASELGASAWYARYWLKDKVQAAHYHQLTMAPLGMQSLRIQSTGPSRLTLSSIGGPLVGEMAIPAGSGHVFQVGMTRSYDDYKVRVQQLGERGPTQVEYEFSRTLNDPQLCLFIQTDAQLYQLTPPAVGSDNVIQGTSPLQILSAADVTPAYLAFSQSTKHQRELQ